MKAVDRTYPVRFAADDMTVSIYSVSTFGLLCLLPGVPALLSYAVPAWIFVCLWLIFVAFYLVDRRFAPSNLINFITRLPFLLLPAYLNLVVFWVTWMSGYFNVYTLAIIMSSWAYVIFSNLFVMIYVDRRAVIDEMRLRGDIYPEAGGWKYKPSAEMRRDLKPSHRLASLHFWLSAALLLGMLLAIAILAPTRASLSTASLERVAIALLTFGPAFSVLTAPWIAEMFLQVQLVSFYRNIRPQQA